MNIDWKRVCKPQPDQYDSHVIARLLHERHGWVKRVPQPGVPTICDGMVAVVKDPTQTEESIAWANAQRPDYPLYNGVDHWNDTIAAKIDPYLRTWTEGHEMLKLFLDEFWPKWSGTMTEDTMGCVSGHYELANRWKYPTSMRDMTLNAVYVTINSPQGCAEGIYHEVGHARLEALGINIENHDGRLILNTDDELYFSPIRRDKKRPMSAVIQAIYSWIIFSENDLQCATVPGTNSAQYLVWNLPKIEDGLKEIQAHVRTTPEGKDFMDSYLEWGYDVCDRARLYCRETFGTEYQSRYDRASEYKLPPKS